MYAENALTTIEAAKDFLGIITPQNGLPGDTTQSQPSEPPEVSDDTLYRYINQASALIESYCKRQFGLKEYTEFIQGRDALNLMVDNYPILSVEEMVIGGETIEATSLRVIPQSGMISRPNGGFPSSTITGRLLRPAPTQHSHNVYVRYIAGYVLPKDATDEVPRTLPYDLELACLRMLRMMKKDAQVADGNALILQSRSPGIF